jgi:hypothetical protein
VALGLQKCNEVTRLRLDKHASAATNANNSGIVENDIITEVRAEVI